MSAMWIARGTRPDLQYQVGALSRVMHRPGRSHWASLCRVARYLRHTRDDGISYHRRPPRWSPVLSVFVDSDFAPDYGPALLGPDFAKYHSTSGWVACVGGQPVAWRSRRQSLFADSTCVAEYLAAAEAAKAAVALRLYLADAGYVQPNPTVVHEDNTGCIKLSRSLCDHDRTKHVDHRAHQLREFHARELVVLKHIPTDQQWANVLTKNCPGPELLRFRRAVMSGSVFAPLAAS